MPLFSGDPATGCAWALGIILALWLASAFLAGWAFHG